MSTATTKPRTVAEQWSQHAGALAAWTDRHMVNRRDTFGRYIAVEARTDPDLTAFTDKSGLALAKLERHFRGESTGDILGLHSTARDEPGGEGETAACWSKWGGIDIDRHDEATDPAATLRAALTWSERLEALGFHPLLIDSNGRGGFHLVVILDGPAPTADVYRFLRWLTRDWRELGLAEKPETFPKQAAIKAGGFGNWLRLPGRHHTRDHWSKVRGKGGWLEGTRAVRAILGTPGDPADLIPAEALVEPEPKARPKGKAKRKGATAGADASRDAELAREALKHLGHLVDGYDDWIEIGQALTPLGAAGLALWEEWSAGSSKYQEGDCERKWRTFAADRGRTLGTLFHHAKQAGWEPPGPRLNPRGRSFRVAGASTNGTGHGSEGGGNGSDEDSTNGTTHHATGPPPLSLFTNFALAEAPAGEDGKTKVIKVALLAREIAEDLAKLAPGWPKRVGGDSTLFIEGSNHRPIYLNSTTRLFSWVDGLAQVDWAKGSRMIPQERFYEHLRMTAEHFDGIETQPHWPRLDGLYYMHPPLPPAQGKLRKFLEFFNPASEVDALLILAAVVTPAWGGPPGKRPAMLIQGPEHDAGRGVGKSTFVDRIGDLYGGVIDVSIGEPIEKIKTRLLTPEFRTRRILRIDNVKTDRLSWGDLENLITTPTISGYQLYAGEGSRANTMMTCITINAASLSKDMATRCAPLRLARPTYHQKWDSTVGRFVQRYRLDILADIGEFFARPPAPIPVRTRWGEWERQILGRLGPDAAEACQNAIGCSQGSVDADEEAKRDLLDAFRAVIVDCGWDPDSERVFFTRPDAAEIVKRCHDDRNMPAPKCYARIRTQLVGTEVRESASDGTRGFQWTGKDADPKAENRMAWLRQTRP